MPTATLNVADLAETAALIGDPARANILLALMDGRALTAGELASVAGVTPQTASGHLARLIERSLLSVEQRGRHRYHRIASPRVAAMIEAIMSIAANPVGRAGCSPLRVGPRDLALRYARTCYDHLAGEVAVAMVDRMSICGHIEIDTDGAALTIAGKIFLGDLGIDLGSAAISRGRRTGPAFCRPCLDWSERRYHLAGAVGAMILQTCLDRNWMRRSPGTRAVLITPPGRSGIEKAFGLQL